MEEEGLSGRDVSLKLVGTVWMVESLLLLMLLGEDSVEVDVILRRERDLAGLGVASFAGLNSSVVCFVMIAVCCCAFCSG